MYYEAVLKSKALRKAGIAGGEKRSKEFVF
jgi:hypothetical protein